MFGHKDDGITWLWCWIYSRAGQWVGHSRYGPMLTSLYKHWKWLTSSEVDRRGCCFTQIRGARADSTGPRNTFNRGGVYGATSGVDEQVDWAKGDALARCAIASPGN